MTLRTKPGDLVVYRKQKHSVSPGKRAKNVAAAAGGDTYTYFVDKYWIVQSIQADGQLCLLTRTGKEHSIRPNDPNLRRANFLERWFLGVRFPGKSS